VGFFNIANVEAVDFNRLMANLPGRQLWNPLSTQGQYIRAILESEEMLRANGINNALRLAHFLGQGIVETGFLAAKAENLNYSFDGLKRTFGRKFASDDEIRAYARKPQQIANRVYANRLGNGPEESGEGWRYRGRGFFQLTGKDNYRRYGELAGVDLVNDPEIIERDLKVSLQVAAAYFDKTGLGEFADRNDIAAVSRGVNRGDPRSRSPAIGEAERIEWTTKALALVRDPTAILNQAPPQPAPEPQQPTPPTEPSQPAPPPPPPSTDLRAGSTGVEVQNVQRLLNALGYAVGADDGVYGPSVERAVLAFQHEHNLPVTGVVDSATRAALEAAVEEATRTTPTRPEIPATPAPPPAPGQQPQPTPAPEKPLSRSRTMLGAILAAVVGVVEFVRATFAQVAALFPVVQAPWGPFNTIYILAGLLLLGLIIVIYARIDDRAKKRR